MPLANRLALIGAASLLAGVIAFTLPLPPGLQPHAEDGPHRKSQSTTGAICKCPLHGLAHHA